MSGQQPMCVYKYNLESDFQHISAEHSHIISNKQSAKFLIPLNNATHTFAAHRESATSTFNMKGKREDLPTKRQDNG